MANGTIKAIIPFNIISGTYTVNEGYFSVISSCIKVGNPIFVQILRGNDTEWNRISAIPRIDNNGYANIFIRNTDGSVPDNGVKIKANILVGGGKRTFAYAVHGCVA